MKDKEKVIEEFRDMIVYLCKNDIKPSDVSSFIWKHHRDESFSEVYKFIKELADAVDQKGVMYNYDQCARKIENLSSTILTTPESLKILTK